jgi:hypothetical protein
MAAATIALPAPTPPPAPIHRAWREPARWPVAGLITFGLVEVFVIFGPGVIRRPAPMLFAAVLFGLHGAFLIWVLRRLDYLEPIALLAPALAWGGIVATSNAVRANVAADSILTKLYPSTFVQRWGPLQHSRADLAGRLVRVDECPGTASVEYPGIARALAQISDARARLGPIGISQSDTIRAQPTRAGWLAMLGGSSLHTPLLVPIVLAVWRVRAARRAHQYADPRLLTGLLIGVTLLVVWLAFHAVGAAQID